MLLTDHARVSLIQSTTFLTKGETKNDSQRVSAPAPARLERFDMSKPDNERQRRHRARRTRAETIRLLNDPASFKIAYDNPHILRHLSVFRKELAQKKNQQTRAERFYRAAAD
jgi:hypothetical protein